MSWQLRLIRALLRLFVKPLLRRDPRPGRGRAGFRPFRPAAVPRAAAAARTTAARRPRWVSAGPAPRAGSILYLHGGAYLSGSPDHPPRDAGPSVGLARVGLRAALSAGAGGSVSRGLRRCGGGVPAARRWDMRPANRAGRRSAGGGLAFALLAWCCARAGAPRGVRLFALDRSCLRRRRLETNRAADPSAVAAAEMAGSISERPIATDPRVSPLFADFPRRAAGAVAARRTEILRDDTRDGGAAARQRREVTVATGAWPHVWQIFDDWLPEARDSRDARRTSCRRAWAAPAGS